MFKATLNQKHIMVQLKQGIGKVYVTIDFICNGLVKLLGRQRNREIHNEQFLPTEGFESSASRLLDWRSNRLCH